MVLYCTHQPGRVPGQKPEITDDQHRHQDRQNQLQARPHRGVHGDDDTIRVYDNVAGHFVRANSSWITPAQERYIRGRCRVEPRAYVEGDTYYILHCGKWLGLSDGSEYPVSRPCGTPLTDRELELLPFASRVDPR